ncbi:MAG TPA: hypothetical protein VFW98_03215 [Gemmatimonadaceae bacterium]|nr:hypothetical protein [Gemmatimonadaceae bacterium]
MSYVLIIAGVGGAPEYTQEFYQEGMRMANAAHTKYGVPDSAIVFLAENPARDPQHIRGLSTRAGVQKAFAHIAATAKPGDLVFVLLIGHGSAQSEQSRFNLPGPDMTAADFARLLKPLRAQRVAFVNAASASADFVPALSAKNRAIITATSSVHERNETRFAAPFVDAYAGDGADADKDGRVSLLEAFTYARREVMRDYHAGNELQTEHAMLDDNGDGKGTGTPGARTPDGGLSSRLFLGGGAAATTVAASHDPRVAALVQHKDSLEAKIDALRRRKASMDSTAYEHAMEALLLDLATTNQAIKPDSGGVP